MFQTPCRKDDALRRCSISTSSSSSKGSCSVRKMANSERASVGDGEGREELTTPACRGGSCAICLSPLKKPSGAKKEVYTVRLCQVSVAALFFGARLAIAVELEVITFRRCVIHNIDTRLYPKRFWVGLSNSEQ